MTCETCLQTKPIPLCINEIVIGQINNPSTDVLVHMKNCATKRTDVIETTSGVDNTVSIDTTDFEFMESHYTFTIKKADDHSALDITIDGETAECVDVSFEQCNEEIDSVNLELK